MKTKLSIWVDGRIAEVIRENASRDSSTVSEYAAALLENAIHHQLEPAGTAVFLPAITSAVRRELALGLERLEGLCWRSAVESDATRRETYQLIAQAFGEDGAARIRHEAWVEARTETERSLRPASTMQASARETLRHEQAPRTDGAAPNPEHPAEHSNRTA